MACYSARLGSRLLGCRFRSRSVILASYFNFNNIPLLQRDNANSGFKIGVIKTDVKFNRLHSSTVNLTNVIRCEKCSHAYELNVTDLIKVVTCPACGSLKKVLPTELPNYFQILGHEQSFKIDLQAIAKKSKHLQKRFHPDLFSQNTRDQQLLSQEYSSLINKAVSTLMDPISRGRYLLTLAAGCSLNSSDCDVEKSMTNDPEFLEEVMELNEKLQEIASENDWKNFRDENVSTMKNIHEKLAHAFETQNLKEAQRLLARLKYYDSLQVRLKDLQSRIGVVE